MVRKGPGREGSRSELSAEANHAGISGNSLLGKDLEAGTRLVLGRTGGRTVGPESEKQERDRL